MDGGDGPIAVFAVGNTAAATMLWRAGERLYATVVVKATFAMRDGERMRMFAPSPLQSRDVHFRGDPLRSVQLPCDLTPFLRRCDVVLHGSAHAPSSTPAKTATVRLAIHRGPDALLDKSLYVYGPRASWDDEPAPFSRVPLDYEHAYGSPSVLENPVGVGAGASGVPSVVDPRRPAKPAGFGAISPSWAPRRALAPDDLEARRAAPVLELPPDLDWAYFQAAPRDQQVAYLRGDEWVSLAGLHPTAARVQSQLPSARGEARVWPRMAAADEPGEPIELQADMLVIDAASLLCSVCWRGTLPVASEEAARGLRVGAGVALGTARLDWQSAAARWLEEQADAPADATVDDVATLDDATLDADVAAAIGRATSSAAGAVAAPEQPRARVRKTREFSLHEPPPDARMPWEKPRPEPPPTPTRRTVRTREFSVHEPPPDARPPWERPADEPRSSAPASDDQTRALRLREPLPGARLPWEDDERPAPSAPRHDPAEETRPVDLAALRAAAGGALPWEEAAPPSFTPEPPPALEPPSWSEPAPTPSSRQGADETTAVVDVARLRSEQAPFPLARGPQLAPATAAVPGAPWSPTAAPSIVAPSAEDTSTLSLEALVASRGRERRAEPANTTGELPALEERDIEEVPQINGAGLAVATNGFQLAGTKALLTVIAKGVCDVVPGAPAELRDELHYPDADVYLDDAPDKSLLRASDFAPVKACADVTLTGHAHAPRGSTVCAVGFRFGEGPNRIERRAVVLADRVWGERPTRTFTTMPLTWERAFGGPGVDANPVGRGGGRSSGAELDPSELMPNIEDPERLLQKRGDRAEPMCFAPISPRWPARQRKLGTIDAAWVRERFPHWPADLDPSFFQAAPAAQRVPFPRGDEPFELWGVHPKHPKLAGWLPGLRPRCFAQMVRRAGGDFREIPLELDTVAFDADDQAVHLVWRGTLEVDAPEAWEVGRLFLVREELDEPPLDLEGARRRYVSAELALHAAHAAGIAGTTGLPVSSLAAAALADLVLPPLPARRPAHLRTSRERVQAQRDSGAPLAELDLVDADLSGMDLSGADLSGALLLRANLAGAALRGANLAGAQLGEAVLSDACLDDATMPLCDLSGALLDRASFARALLDNAQFTGARGDDANFEQSLGRLPSFARATLPRARFDGADLFAPDFTGAALEGASFAQAVLVQARLFDAKLDAARFTDALLPEASALRACLRGAQLQRVQAPESVWEQACLDASDWSAATLTGASFVKASCERAVFSGADLRGARLRKTKLVKAKLDASNLMEAQLESADLSGADLSGANLYGTVGFAVTLSGAKIDGAILDGSSVFGTTKARAGK